MKSARESATPLLPDELLWADGGHASDVVLTALSDGQTAIVPAPVRAHVERCTVCTTYLGHAALLSLYVARELEARAEHERSTARRPLPRSAIALGLVVAVVGLLPTVFDLALEPSGLRNFATREVPLSLRGVSTLVHHLDRPGSAVGIVVTYGAALLLLAMGFAVARLLPKKKEASR
jgi:hypothetical protein